MVEVIDIENDKGFLCRSILEALPDWFGIPAAIDKYAADVEALPMLGARSGEAIVGFIALKYHTTVAVEAYVLGVRREYHRQGIGRALFTAAERAAIGQGAKFLTVRTVAADDADPHYGATRLFYEAIGFLPIEVFPTLWDPCLFMVKPLLDKPGGS